MGANNSRLAEEDPELEVSNRRVDGPYTSQLRRHSGESSDDEEPEKLPRSRGVASETLRAEEPGTLPLHTGVASEPIKAEESGPRDIQSYPDPTSAEVRASVDLDSKTTLLEPSDPSYPHSPPTICSSTSASNMVVSSPTQLIGGQAALEALVYPKMLQEVLSLRDSSMGARILLQNERSDYRSQRSYVINWTYELEEALQEYMTSGAVQQSSDQRPGGAILVSVEKLRRSLDFLGKSEKQMRKAEKKLEQAEDKLWAAESRLYDHLKDPDPFNAPSQSVSTLATSDIGPAENTGYNFIFSGESSPAETPPLLRAYYRRLIDFNLLRQRLLEIGASNRREGGSPREIERQGASSTLQQGEHSAHQDHELQAKLVQDLSVASDDLFLMRGQLSHDGIVVAGPSLPSTFLDIIPEDLQKNVGNLAGLAVAPGSTTPPMSIRDKADLSTRVSGWLNNVDSSESNEKKIQSAPATPYKPLLEDVTPRNHFASPLRRASADADLLSNTSLAVRIPQLSAVQASYHGHGR